MQRLSSRFNSRILARTIVFSLILTSCNLPLSTPVSTPTTFLFFTPTVQVQLTQPTLITPSSTLTVIPSPSPTNTAVSSFVTPIPPRVISASATPLCDKAQFIQDISFPDGATVPKGTSIAKTWRLKNVGTCTWTTGYSLVFDQGTILGPGGGSPGPVAFTSPVPPGHMVDVTVNLVAPSTPGNYQSYFRLRSAAGNLFGVGSSGKGTFWVKITVPTSYP